MCGLTISIKTIKAKRRAKRWHFELSRVTPGLDVVSAGTVRRRTGKSVMNKGKPWDQEVFISLCSCSIEAVCFWIRNLNSESSTAMIEHWNKRLLFGELLLWNKCLALVHVVVTQCRNQQKMTQDRLLHNEGWVPLKSSMLLKNDQCWAKL